MKLIYVKMCTYLNDYSNVLWLSEPSVTQQWVEASQMEKIRVILVMRFCILTIRLSTVIAY